MNRTRLEKFFRVYLTPKQRDTLNWLRMKKDLTDKDIYELCVRFIDANKRRLRAKNETRKNHPKSVRTQFQTANIRQNYLE